jgi:hypothetical protein
LLYSVVIANVSPFFVGAKMPVGSIVHRSVMHYATLRLASATDVAAIDIAHI